MPRPITKDTLIGRVLHEWHVEEYFRHDRGARWHTVMGGIAVALVLFATFTGNFLFSLIIILGGIILFVQNKQDAPKVHFSITELGVTLNTRFYPYSELESFYIIYNPPHVKTLFLETRSAVRPLIRIPLYDINPVEVRYSLREFLDEDVEKEEEPAGDMLARRWMLH